jgi:hypothetical protein
VQGRVVGFEFEKTIFKLMDTALDDAAGYRHSCDLLRSLAQRWRGHAGLRKVEWQKLL